MQLYQKLASMDMLIETYHLRRRTLQRHKIIARKDGRFGGNRRKVSCMS